MRTSKEYWESVESFAREAFDRIAEGEDEGDVLNEITDQADWIIYTAHAIAVLQHTDNDDAIFEEMGKEALADVESSADVYVRMAFYAMRQDIAECLALNREEWGTES